MFAQKMLKQMIYITQRENNNRNAQQRNNFVSSYYEDEIGFIYIMTDYFGATITYWISMSVINKMIQNIKGIRLYFWTKQRV